MGKNGILKLIASTGESIPGDIPQTGNTNTKCRFALPVTEWIEQWCSAGPTHHLALGIGHHTETLRIFAKMSGIDLLEIK